MASNDPPQFPRSDWEDQSAYRKQLEETRLRLEREETNAGVPQGSPAERSPEWPGVSEVYGSPAMMTKKPDPPPQQPPTPVVPPMPAPVYGAPPFTPPWPGKPGSWFQELLKRLGKG